MPTNILTKRLGPPPGENLKNILLSTADIAEILDIAEATASELVAKEQFELTLCLWETPYRKEQFRAMVSITVLLSNSRRSAQRSGTIWRDIDDAANCSSFWAYIATRSTTW